MASNLSVGSGLVVIVYSTGSPDPRQHPFGSGHQPVSGQLSATRRRRGRPDPVPVSCRLSATGIRFSGHPVPAGELGLPHGRLTGHECRPDPDGVSTFHTQRDTTGVGALSTPGTAVLTPAGCRARPAPAASQRPVPTPRCNNPSAGPRITRHQRRFTRFTRPAFPSPVIPGWNEDPWACPSSFAPRRYQRRTSKAGPRREHAPGTTPPTSAGPPIHRSLATCDLVSQRQIRMFTLGRRVDSYAFLIALQREPANRVVGVRPVPTRR